ncbi:DUF5134 domain-containing protein [Pseudonocardia adelaidensis]
MTWVTGVLAAGCLAVGLFHIARLVVLRRDVASELAHAAMGAGMAAMFSPLDDPVPGPVWTLVFVLCLAWFGGAVLRSRTFGGDAGHHVVASGAMLLVLAAGHGPGTTRTLGMASVVALGLAGYFAWHTLRCADRCRRPEPAAPGAARAAVRARVLEAPGPAAAAQLVTAAAMAVMLLGTI